MQNELLDVQEVATRLRLNPRTVLRMADRGDLPGIKVARRWRFRSSDLNTYLQSNHTTASEEGWSGEELEEVSINKEAQNGEQKTQLDRKKEELQLEKEQLALQ